MNKHSDHDTFIEAIHSKKMVSVTYYAKKYGKNRTRLCAPLDFGPSRRQGRIIDGGEIKYHFYDYESESGAHPVPIETKFIINMKITNDEFSPADFINWSLIENPWFVDRNWGEYS